MVATGLAKRPRSASLAVSAEKVVVSRRLDRRPVSEVVACPLEIADVPLRPASKAMAVSGETTGRLTGLVCRPSEAASADISQTGARPTPLQTTSLASP